MISSPLQASNASGRNSSQSAHFFVSTGELSGFQPLVLWLLIGYFPGPLPAPSMSNLPALVADT